MGQRLYWRDCDLRTLDDRALIELGDQLDTLCTNRHVRDDPELLATVGMRLGQVCDELYARAQLTLWD